MSRLFFVTAMACVVLFLSPTANATIADDAIITAMRAAAPLLPNAVIVKRMPTGTGFDIVVALASLRPLNPDLTGRYWWLTHDRLGLFLQASSDTAQITRLALEAGPNDDCAARIESMSARALVLSCIGEKWSTYDNRKFVYDVRGKVLLSSFSYAPFWTERVLSGKDGPRFVMANNRQLLLVDINPATGAPRVVPQAEAMSVLSQIPMQETNAGGQTFHTPAPAADPSAAFGAGERFRLVRKKNVYGSERTVIEDRSGAAYPLPQSDFATWRESRPDDAATFVHPDQAERNEEIGPHQLLGDRLWFGKTFYNSEGATGVGGFGYFDANTAAYRLYSPPQIQRWSVSAILVEPACAWLALYRRGEYGNSPGGLLRWDWQTNQARMFTIQEIVTSIVRSGDAVYLGATDGIVALSGGRTTSYFVDRAAEGDFQISAR